MCVRAEAAGRNWDDRSSLGWVTPPRLQLILEAPNRGIEPFGGGSGAGCPARAASCRSPPEHFYPPPITTHWGLRRLPAPPESPTLWRRCGTNLQPASPSWR